MSMQSHDPGLQLRTALVTGATSGIGKAAALRLALDGFDTIVHGRDAGRGAEVVDAIERSGGRGRFAGTDLAGNPFLAVRFAEAIALTSAEGASDTVVPATLITYSLLVVGGR